MPHIVNVGARSRLVTALGWLALASALMSGLAGLGGLMQPGGWWAEGALAPWLAAHRVVAGALWLLLALGAVVTAVGLIRRLEWARRLFVALLLAAMLLHLGGLLLQQADLLWGVWAAGAAQATAGAGAGHAAPPGLLQGLAQRFAELGLAARAALALGTLGLGLLLGWLAWRLQQPLVRQEFA